MKTSKLIVTLLAVVTLGLFTLAMSGCKEKSSTQNSDQTVKYTCGMHPDVVQDKPGNCPKCSMALVEKR